MNGRIVNNTRARRLRVKFSSASTAMPVAKQSHSQTRAAQGRTPVRPKFKAALQEKLPDCAPEMWPGRCHTKEDVAVFVRRVWKKYLPAGLTLRHIEKLDEKLYNAIRGYHAVTGKHWPKDLARISERGRLADALERAKTDGVDAVTPKELMAVARKLARDLAPN
jgi:hypothetical protein